MLKIIATAALLATTAPALAEPQGTTQQFHVSYADLDLRQAKDVRLFDRRIRAAVEAVCPDVITTGSLLNSATKRCRKEAYAALAEQRAVAIAHAAGTTQLAANVAGH
jgi:UrcA family protein